MILSGLAESGSHAAAATGGGVARSVVDLFRMGGWVMWPLLALSWASVMLSLERGVFWLFSGESRARREASLLGVELRHGRVAEARRVAASGRSASSRLVSGLLADRDAGILSDAGAIAELDTARRRLDRFSVTLATIVAAAPLLGILGTVTGIIQAFRIYGDAPASSHIALVADHIGEALITTAFGLVVAISTLGVHATCRARASSVMAALDVLAEIVVEACERVQRSAPLGHRGQQDQRLGHQRDLSAALHEEHRAEGSSDHQSPEARRTVSVASSDGPRTPAGA